MSGPVAPRTPPVLADAERYLTETAPGHGGRNTRPLALPTLTATYVSSARTGQGVAAGLLGVLGGAIAWFGLAQLAQPEPSVVLAVVALLVAAAAVAAGAVLGLRVVRDGASLVAAMRRWHAIAPEVPVPGVGVLTSGPALVRLVVAGVAVVVGVGAAIGAVVGGTLATGVGLGIVAVTLTGSGALAATGWWRVRSMLRSATPQGDHSGFAPAAAVPDPQHWAPGQQIGGGQSAQQWAPPPPPSPGPPPPAPVPWSPPPASNAPSATTWQGAPEVVDARSAGSTGFTGQALAPVAPESDLGDTRLAADTTLSGRGERAAVVLDDGTRLPSGVTVIGRDPRPRATDADAERMLVLHPSVSKTHATFRVADTIHVTDRASTNGTTVVGADGVRLRLQPWTEHRLAVGDTVLLGSYRVRVVADD